MPGTPDSMRRSPVLPAFVPVLCSLLWVLCFLAPVSSAQTVRIAAASDLQFALSDLAAQYEKQSGQKLALSYGSSGNFYAQIQNGAPFDLFFSADTSYPDKLLQAGLAQPGAVSVYAQGRIVLWFPQDSPLDRDKLGWKVLLDRRIKKIAIANPEYAPYGRAAVLALQRSGLYDQIKAKLVLGENISQAAQFVQSGNAQAGIVALSLALSPAMKDGKHWEIPLDQYPPIEQAVVLLKSSPNQPAARAFLAFLESQASRATLSRYGFTLPTTASFPGGKP
jgi:molybdate transport system substrate-binding protein